MHAGNIEHRIGPGAPARTRTTHTVGHRRGLRQTAWSLLILKAPTPSTHDQHATPALLTHAHLRRPALPAHRCHSVQPVPFGVGHDLLNFASFLTYQRH